MDQVSVPMVDKADWIPVTYQRPRKPTIAIANPTGIWSRIITPRRIKIPIRPVIYFSPF
jgi:hypothetical protein